MKNEENVQFIPPLRLFQIYLRFLEYQMENSNECKKNFVAVYDGSNAIEDLKVRICCFTVMICIFSEIQRLDQLHLISCKSFLHFQFSVTADLSVFRV